ncbi:MAG TPA: flagellar export chaperone FliS [Candidatus Bathyarchaeia archaeon]|nr:flagellar export chaperone FliS [Candidatus Bathyarchaeia archaeon]
MPETASGQLPSNSTGHMAYKKVDVETASQGKLIVMLFNGAIQRAEEAKRQLQKDRIDGVHNNLVRAQEIIAELRSALDMNGGGDIARNLNRIYEYLQHLLVKANIQKKAIPIEECINLMTIMRDTWQDLFLKVSTETPPTAAPPKINPHGSAFLNLEG